MIQMLVGVAIVASGIYLLIQDSLIAGILPVVAGGALFNGASYGTWFSFRSEHDDVDGGGGDD
ncbi:MAG: hypothetical protein GY802_28490 [Gammaproteobacteria bacterium]|nr:hypothetical protein [Gammaproteobacteria bacterium]